MRRKNSLEEKRDLLEKCQSVLDTRILMRLDARSLKQTHDIYELDRRVQDLVSAVEQGSNTFAELMTRESQGIKAHFDKKFDSHVQSTEERLARDQLCESFFFPEIMSRQEEVPEAFKGTCHWIFDTSADQRSRSRPWSNFRNWLENDEGVYWISGKPGSGKSTLMKYIVDADLTPQLLSNWKKDTDLLVVSFFFWEAGTAQQKSCTGLLRSLLFRIATHWPELVDLMGAQHGNRKGGVEAWKNLLPAWTDERLLFILTKFLDQKPTSVSLCAFVDGLDEFVGEEEVLLNVIRLFINTPQCKMCVSSRPEQAFRHEFKSCPQLRVQDLNHEDIERTVAGKLFPSLTKYTRIDSRELDDLNNTLIWKAQGVFLWLDLMIRDLITGARNRDTATMLWSRLERAPETINGMYTHILSSLDPLYEKESFKYFSVLLAAEEFNLRSNFLRLVCAEDEPWEHVVNFDLDYFGTAKFDSACRDFETRLIACCGSLIDIQDHLSDEGAEKKSNVKRHHRNVNFVHKTALEYVREKYKENLLDPHSHVEANTHLARGGIGLLVMSPLTSFIDNSDKWPDRNFRDGIRNTMSMISVTGSHYSTADVDKSSVVVQLDLTNRAFDSLQNLYTFVYHLEQDWYSDSRFLRRLVYLGNADDKSWLPFNDHLSGAAFFGCNHYIQSQLSSHSLAENQAENLLQSALAGIEYFLIDPMRVTSHCALAKLLTVQIVVQHKLNVEKLYFATPRGYMKIEHSTFWGAFFILLMLYSHFYSESASEPVEEALKSCITELVETFLSLGANPNSRIVYSGVIFGGTNDYQFILAESPIAVIGPSIQGLGQLGSQLKARLLSAGAVHHRRFLYFKKKRNSDLWYSLDRHSDLSERLSNRLPLSFGFIHSDEAINETLATLAEEDKLSWEDVRKEIRNSSLSF